MVFLLSCLCGRPRGIVGAYLHAVIPYQNTSYFIGRSMRNIMYTSLLSTVYAVYRYLFLYIVGGDGIFSMVFYRGCLYYVILGDICSPRTIYAMST